MRVPLSWLREFVALPDSLDELTALLDDLGLVVEGVERVGEGLGEVVVARVDEIHAIEGADRIRRVIVEAGSGPLQIVCGAMNFVVGNYVPLAPVGAVLPGDFAIAERKMKGVSSFGMLCSGRELGLGEDHSGLLILDAYDGVAPGVSLTQLLGIEPEVIIDISPEGNRPDAWSIVGIARDIATRRGVPFTDSTAPLVAPTSSGSISASIASPELCGSLHVYEIDGLAVRESTSIIARRLEQAGMRPVNNIVDASNYVMLERGQPTHPYDATQVAGRTLGVRAARSGETLETLDGTSRTLGVPGRGLGDTGIDCVIVDGYDTTIGLAGVMGGASSEIADTTSQVMLEIAFFDPMTIARTSKRLGLRSEASHRFERGVDFTQAAVVASRFVEILRMTCPDIRVVAYAHAEGTLPELPRLTVSESDISRLLGTDISAADASRLLGGIGFTTSVNGDVVTVDAPASRLDIRAGAPGRADVIEEIARLFSYRRLERRTPLWPQPGGLSVAQRERRLVRDVAVGLGWSEAWTASLLSDEDVALTHPTATPVRVTNPLASEESLYRTSMIVGLVKSWARNAERGLDEAALFEIGTIATHPRDAATPRRARGGVGGSIEMDLPVEREVLTVALGRSVDDATTAVASWSVIASRLNLADVAVESAAAPVGWHPTRHATLRDVRTGTIFGRIGEVDPSLVGKIAISQFSERRIALLEIDLTSLLDYNVVTRRDVRVAVPSRFPAASFDLALVTPTSVSSHQLRSALSESHELVESVTLFDVFHGASLPADTRSVTFAIRLSAPDRTLSESEVADARAALLAAANGLSATLR